MIPHLVPRGRKHRRRRYRLLPTSRAALVTAIHRYEPWNTTTGPRTFEGKMISRLNATKHGMYGRAAAIAILQAPAGFKAVCASPPDDRDPPRPAPS